VRALVGHHAAKYSGGCDASYGRVVQAACAHLSSVGRKHPSVAIQAVAQGLIVDKLRAKLAADGMYTGVTMHCSDLYPEQAAAKYAVQPIGDKNDMKEVATGSCDVAIARNCFYHPLLSYALMRDHVRLLREDGLLLVSSAGFNQLGNLSWALLAALRAGVVTLEQRYVDEDGYIHTFVLRRTRDAPHKGMAWGAFPLETLIGVAGAGSFSSAAASASSPLSAASVLSAALHAGMAVHERAQQHAAHANFFTGAQAFITALAPGLLDMQTGYLSTGSSMQPRNRAVGLLAHQFGRGRAAGARCKQEKAGSIRKPHYRWWR